MQDATGRLHCLALHLHPAQIPLSKGQGCRTQNTACTHCTAEIQQKVSKETEGNQRLIHRQMETPCLPSRQWSQIRSTMGYCGQAESPTMNTFIPEVKVQCMALTVCSFNSINNSATILEKDPCWKLGINVRNCLFTCPALLVPFGACDCCAGVICAPSGRREPKMNSSGSHC